MRCEWYNNYTYVRDSYQNKFIELLPDSETRIVIFGELSRAGMRYV